MATKGYSSYRGRASAKKVALVIVLVLVILAAAGYLVAQNYIVYDADGNARLELPFKKPAKNPKPEGGDVLLDVQEPEDALLPVSPLMARELPENALLLDPAAVLKENPGDLVIPVKLINGGITFDIAADIPRQVGREAGDSLDNLKTLLAAGRYTVAHLCCLCDSYFVRAYPDAAFSLQSGSYWYDAQGWTWLDPANTETVSYLRTLCRELAALGFDEIALDYFSYPTIGNTAAIANLPETGRLETMTALAAALRAELPADMPLSVVLRSEVSQELGLSYELLTDAFERIYLAPGADTAALTAALPEGYDARRLVPMTTAAQEGSYVLLPAVRSSAVE